jgi:uncharacterized membrane protein
MIRAAALLFCLLLPGLASAQSWPALHDVTGVAAGDVLNIRAEPRAAAERVGALAHDARAVEVVQVRGGWGLVNSGEGAGWVSMRYLAPRVSGDHALTRHITCFGTEPFWSLDITQGQTLRLSSPGDGDRTFPAGLLQPSANRSDRFVLRGGQLTAVIAHGACTDGMSDRQFGLTIDMLPDDGDDTRLLSGCCSLTGN